MIRYFSLNLLLSIMKEESFVCRDARIRTRDLEYRNQTWSVRIHCTDAVIALNAGNLVRRAGGSIYSV
jgi:hypothetical protein